MLNRFCLNLEILLLTICLINGEQSPIQYSKVKIPIASPDDVKRLQIAGLGLDHFRVIENEYLNVILDKRQIDLLNTIGTPYEILIDDVIEDYLQNVRKSDDDLIPLGREMREQFDIDGFEFGSMGGYYTYSEIMTELDSMRLLYPALITVKQSIGLSIDSLDIWMVKISDNSDVDEEEPEILYTALTHAREPQTMATVMYFMYYLLENYGTDPFVTYLVNNRELYFVPVSNPDGYVYNEQTNSNGGGMWRKNKSDNNSNGVFDPYYDGVDINRNYGYMWDYDDEGSSPFPTHLCYRGPSPFSEPESQVIRDLCIDRNFQLAMVYHSPIRTIGQPWRYVNELSPDSLIFVDLLLNMTQYNNYLMKDYSMPYLGLGNGCQDDWMYGEQTTKNKIIAILPETGPGGWVFWPSQSQIYPIAEELVYSNLVLALGPSVLDIDTTLQIQFATISTGYLAPGIDTVFIQAGINNPENLPVSLNAFIEDFDHTTIDTIQLYDDGSHYDSTANDGIFGAAMLASTDKNHYSAHVYTYSDSGFQYFSNNIGRFTTIGPLVIDDYYFYGSDTIPNHGDGSIKMKIVLNNQDNSTPVTNITASLTAIDTNALVRIESDPVYGDIVSGGFATTTGYYIIRFYDVGPDTIHACFKLDIASDGYVLWSDTLSVLVRREGVGVKDELDIPDKFVLHQNYPNPFNPITAIQYELPKRSDVQITIYDLLGRKMVTLLSETQEAGYKSVKWNAMNIASGMYFYQLKTDDFVQTKKMVLLK